jgi:SAM-dependent methyltransferase
MHGGYFSDPAIAEPFIEFVQKAIDVSNPEVIVDLGGGTGFVLNELIKRCSDPGICLVNLDVSQKQLNLTHDSRILSVCRSIAEFRRSDIDPGDKSFLFIMRSALHYFGREGLMPLLRHLRSQMKHGEFFVHHTACFNSAVGARCLNRLYDCMGTGKWYPTSKQLCRFLEKAGWSIMSVDPAPALTLTSEDLGKRYKLNKQRRIEISNDLKKVFGKKEDIFIPNPRGFRAYLHYKIFTCIAV